MTCRLLLALTSLLVILPWSPAQADQGAEKPQEVLDTGLTILLSNDDGIDAPGLEALYEALSPIARVVVAAPATDESGMSHSVTYKEPILVFPRHHRDGATWYTIRARPAMCVRLGLKALLDRPPDFVLAGINRGDNLGTVTWISGTVAAAREAALWGIPAMAVSMTGNAVEDYRAAAAFTKHLVLQARAAGGFRPGLLLNVNVPAGSASGIKGVRVTRLSLLLPDAGFKRRSSPTGTLYFRSTTRSPKADQEGTDVQAHAQGYVSITPLSVNQNVPEPPAWLLTLESK